ncbi:glycosyl hydrolase family 28-related protein [Paenibacillus sp. D2_2]|uniref:glycosyl hydrolase family 28-related protein n=1 Tax=Paenibacillus sp. D2_2 TaxID=3073092 RepID=UPI002815AE6B|nr:glycosyl hydrolase family 28-related protein [Paenibacillus sp. D2_2]WMT42377.1 glycosyl hydrolase family 28-related protein [Paenibacillus sp. D2_2]
MATSPIPDGSVTTSTIANEAVTSSKLDPETNGYVNIRSFGAKGNGVVDDTIAIQNAINAGNSGGKVVVFPPGVYKVSSGHMRNSSNLEWWCIRIPSEANLHFEPGAKLVLDSNPPSDTRVLVIFNASNIIISGSIEIDGSASTVKSAVNDQLHGLFISSSQNVWIESVYSHDCYGDNIFVGGTEEVPSVNIQIGYARCETAGRKNFVIHYVDQLHVNSAVLNNSRGGAPNFTGSDSLHLEPDEFKGTRSFYQRFDSVTTTGCGNSLSTGITDELARLWTLDIGSLDMRVGGTDNPALLSYGVTLKINHLSIKSMDHKASYGLQTIYSQFIDIGSARIHGIGGPAIYAAFSSGCKPRLHIGSLEVYSSSSPLASGVRIDGGDLYIGTLDAQDLNGNALQLFTTENDTMVTIDNMIVRNSGSNQVVLLSSYGANKPFVHLNNVAVFDTRTTKVKRILEFETLVAMQGTTLGTLYNPYSITEWFSTYGNFKRALRLTGGTLLPAVFIVEGSPEGILFAPIGSLAMRLDGTGQSTLYVKESGTGTIGWKAK